MYRFAGLAVVRIAAVVGLVLAVACGSAPAQQPAGQAAKPGGQAAQPQQPAAASSKPQVDADVQQAYDQFVAKAMPKVPIELVQAAKRDGALTFYHLVEPANPKLVAEFQKIFPFVKVQVQQLNGGALVEKFMAESRAGQHVADVLQFSSLTDAKKAQAEGFLMQYKVSIEDELPQDQMVPGYVIPYSSSIMGIGYNPQRIKDEDAKILRQWEGLFDARWDGKRFAVGEVMAGGTTQLTNYYSFKTFGTKLWERMAKSGHAVFPGINPQLDSIVSGENDLSVGGPIGQAIPRWEKGAPLHWHYPEPHLPLPYGQFINAKAPHPNAAKLFQEFIMTIPSQEIIVATGNSSYRKGVQVTAKYASEPWFMAPDPAKSWAYNHDELSAAMPEIAKQWRAILK